MKNFNVYNVLIDYSLELTTDYVHEEDYEIYTEAVCLDALCFEIEYLVHDLARETHYVITKDNAPDLTGYSLADLDKLKLK